MKTRLLPAIKFVLLIALAKTTYAQPDIWTWVSGDSISGAQGYYGTRGVSSPLNKPMGRAIASNWKDNAGNMWIYGGYTNDWGGGSYLSDLWKYNSTVNQWTWVNGDSGFQHHPVYGTIGISSPNNKPGARKDAAYWKDNSDNLWLFAGNGCASDGCAAPTNDLWKYNITTNQWSFVKGDTVVWQDGYVGTQGVPATNNLPASRTAPQAWCDKSGYFWVFSGSSSYPGLWPTPDMWRFNPTTNQWTWMQGDPVGQAPAHYGVKGVASSANVPPARSNACTWTDTSGNLWMYGGSAFSNYYSDMWMFNTAANQWTWISGDSTSKPVTYGTLGVASATNTPGGGRDNASGWRDNVGGDLWLFGGSNGSSSGNSRSFKDVWRYSIATNRWAWMGGDTTAGFPIYNTMGVASYSNIMGTRSKPAAWVDDASGKLYVSCGYDLWVGVYLNDVWTYSPSIPFPIALPLHLLSFTARREAPNNLLRWTTANEVNVDRFEIERTSNGTEFKKIGIVKAGLSNYNFTDSKPLANVNYYRIKMIDRDGKFEYSPVRQITISNSLLSIALYPNPAKDHFNLNIYTPTAQQAQVQMTDQAGKVIRQQGISLLAGENNQNIRVSDIAPGIYLLKVIYREGITQTTKWIKE